MSESVPIWGDQVIEVLGVTGPIDSGKTLFLLSIAEPERTCIYDCEKSSSNYVSLGFKRVDLIDLAMKKSKGVYSPLEMYIAFKESISKIKPGEFDVVAVDPASELESGIVDYVKSKYAEYGFKSAESFVRMEGRFWQAVNCELKISIMNLVAKIQTFAFSMHLRSEYVDGKPTKRQTPKGKKVFNELTSLYIELSRPKPHPNKPAIRIPRGRVLKSRLCHLRKTPTGFRKITILPEQLPEATPDAIRAYIASPADWDNPKDGEVYTDPVLSETEKIEAQSRVAENNRLAAEAALEAANVSERVEQVREEARRRLMPGRDIDKTDAVSNNGDNKSVTAEELRSLLKTAKEMNVEDKVRQSLMKFLKVDKLTAKHAEKLPREKFEALVTKTQNAKG